MNKETRKALEGEIARLIPKAVYRMKNTYKDDEGFLALQDFFLAVPFKIVIEEVDSGDDQGTGSDDIYPSIYKYIGGYTKLVNEDLDIKCLKVFIVIRVPSNLESPDAAKDWVKDNLINNKDLAGENALLMVYMHEIMHIMLKHLTPSVNAKFDAIIKQHAQGKKLPEMVMHKVKNFAEDFLINSLLLENAHPDSKLHQLADEVKYKDKKITFLYNPELSASNGMTVETIIPELLKDMEIEEIGGSGNGSGDDSSESQDGSGSGDDSGESQDGSGNGSGQGKIKGTRYKIKYGDFEYEVWDMHDEQNGQAGDGSNDEDIAKAVKDAMNQVANKMKGSGTAKLAAKLGLPVEVTVDWLEKLESDLFKEVRHRTHKVSSTWSRLKNKYRHVAPLPATVNYENVLNAIIVIDESGSMGDLELRKINYIIKKLVKRVKELQVIIHDSTIVFNKKYKRIVDRELEKEIFSKRHAAGGTSHRDVFDTIENEYESKINEDFIVLIFSDMYSDIELLWGKYSWTDTVKTYLISTDKQGVEYIKNVPATKILMDTGEKL